jgi:membrane protein
MSSAGIINKILRWRTVRLVRIWLMRATLPGFDGIPLYNVLVFFFRSLTKGAITQRAAAISFNFFLALFPAILFFFTLIPYIPIDNFQATLMALIEDSVPRATFHTIETTVMEIVMRPHDSLMSIGFFMALFFATNGFKSIMTAFETSVYNEEDRPFFKTQLVALFLLIITSLVTIITISLITFNRVFLDFLVEYKFLKNNEFYYWLIYVVNIILEVLMIFFSVSFIYYYAPVNRKQYRFISAGSTFATILFVLTFIGFDAYITHFSRYNVLYGSIGTLIIILMWIYVNSIVLLIGFELNASIKTLRKSDHFSLFKSKKEIRSMQKKMEKERKLEAKKNDSD